ncbi:hypothetical protein JOB18_039494 [Solea senegalensis]|uniref:Uncharacterized protein n=1 Tax=Solea senegalensis TaxID=28829 RepID=A0AAV6S5E2_SOLSE|nr:hypothetical protein JOB18_039494 [Solea senegalensis]
MLMRRREVNGQEVRRFRNSCHRAHAPDRSESAHKLGKKAQFVPGGDKVEEDGWMDQRNLRIIRCHNPASAYFTFKHHSADTA